MQRPASELLDSDRLVAFCGARCLHELMSSELGSRSALSPNSCQRYPCSTASWYAVVTKSGPATASSSSRCEAPASCQPVIRPSTTRTGRSGPRTRSVQPSAACTKPLLVVADSRARVAVVPTAITRPPVSCVRFTNRAVVRGTSNSSATGGSPASVEETPACSVIGAIVMPDVIREVTSSVLKGRAALAISALPASGRTPSGSR